MNSHRVGEASDPLKILRNYLLPIPQRFLWYLYLLCFGTVHILRGEGKVCLFVLFFVFLSQHPNKPCFLNSKMLKKNHA